MKGFSANSAAALLATHFRAGTRALPGIPGPSSRAEAYRVQDLLVESLGGACRGWKVGKAKTDAEPYCAPIPVERQLYSSGDYERFHGVALVEAELGFRLGSDVPPGTAIGDRAECSELIDAIVPAFEILETRLALPAAQDPLWKLADLQANGGLVLGNPVKWEAQDLERVHLAIGAETADEFHDVAHPFGSPFDLFWWTVNHVASKRGGLRQGDVIITGSYCGIVEIHAPQEFVATFADYGTLRLNVR